MLQTFTGKAKELWYTWDIHFFVLASLSIQIILILLVPLRRRTASDILGSLIWFCYLLADSVAIFAIGLISKAQDTYSASSLNTNHHHQSSNIVVFWAPFLVLHLGGPDSITALALEDNALWTRHLLQLLTQVGTTLYVFYQAFSSRKLRRLWPVIWLMFFAGAFKYLERSISLYLASLYHFRNSLLTEPDPGPDYVELMAEYSSRKEAKLPTDFILTLENEEDDIIFEEAANYDEAGDDDDDDDGHCKPNELDYVNTVQEAYGFFVRFRGLIVDLILSFKERNDSSKFFLKFKPEEAKIAFEIIEIELNFMYGIFYTKMVLRHNYPIYVIYSLRLLCLGLIIAAATVFVIKERHYYSGVEVVITYILLGGAITLDTYALLKLYLSEWTIATRREREKRMKDKWSSPGYWVGQLAVWVRDLLIRMFPIKLEILQRRRSEAISQFSILDYCLREHPGGCRKCLYVIGLEDKLTGWRYVKENKYTSAIRDFIFKELQIKSRKAVSPGITKNICSARGNGVLPHFNFREWILDVDYDESLLIWHVATELLYNLKGDTPNEDEKKSCSRILSNYMVYLLLRQAAMMSAVADIARIRFQDTCAEAKRFIAREDHVGGGGG